MKFFILIVGVGLFGFSFFVKQKILVNLKIFCFSWLNPMSIDIFMDSSSVLFFSVLMVIVFSVKIFSEFYLSGDQKYNRFYWILMGFVFSMCLVMFFPKMVFILVGWDGLGLTSFILIVYYKTSKSWFCGLKTYLINRLGDGLMVVWVLSLFFYGKWKFFFLGGFESILLGLVVILGLFTKSAQYPFCSWLPAAMAAPTPVSALVHSSTLVTAGMFILFRISPVFNPTMFFFVGVMSLLTVFISSLAACVEWDLKKVMAFSTLSQLGVMGISLACGLNNLCFFHLMSHAVFKALLFICGGVLLGQHHHFQDLRNISSIKGFNPLIDFVMFMSMLSLAGFPFLSGFYSKDIMLENNQLMLNGVFFGGVLLTLPLTVYYSFRMIFYLWNGGVLGLASFKSLNPQNTLSMMFLFGFSCFLGKIFKILEKNNKFLSGLDKGVVWALLAGGGVLVFFSKNYANNWFFSKIFFCEKMNTTLWSNYFSKVGFVLGVVDQTTNKTMKTGLVKSFILMNRLLKKMMSSLIQLPFLLVGFVLVGLCFF